MKASGRPWTPTDDATLHALTAAGQSSVTIGEALGRSYMAVQTRRRVVLGLRQRRGKTRAATPRERRIVALEATIAAALRKPDWDLIDELLGGLEWLRGR